MFNNIGGIGNSFGIGAGFSIGAGFGAIASSIGNNISGLGINDTFQSNLLGGLSGGILGGLIGGILGGLIGGLLGSMLSNPLSQLGQTPFSPFSMGFPGAGFPGMMTPQLGGFNQFNPNCCQPNSTNNQLIILLLIMLLMIMLQQQNQNNNQFQQLQGGLNLNIVNINSSFGFPFLR